MASSPLLPSPFFNGFSSRTRVSATPLLFRCIPKKSPFLSALPSDSMFDREETRWLREEQRWLREEKRWIREETRWKSERESLILEIADLKLQIQALKKEKLSQEASVTDLISNLSSLLQSLKDLDFKSQSQIPEKGLKSQSQIPERGLGSPVPFKERVGDAEMEEVKEVVFEEVRVSEKPKKKKKRMLRTGSEGKDVRAMQEALQKLGFYSGEEDMEYSSFSSGTERAVKTWQATLGMLENGVMTEELLEKLFMGNDTLEADLEVNFDQNGQISTMVGEDVVNRVAGAVASVTELTEIQHAVVKENGVAEVGVSEHRVFLLGENRWEEPSRLIGRDKQLDGSKARAPTKCLACRGEGHLLCTECDGTGEPNIEPQFLEWVGEETKCPYCEGLGYTICDVCEGKPTLF